MNENKMNKFNNQSKNKLDPVPSLMRKNWAATKIFEQFIITISFFLYQVMKKKERNCRKVEDKITSVVIATGFDDKEVIIETQRIAHY